MKRFVAFLLLGLILVGAAEWDLHQRAFTPIRKLDNFWIDFCIGQARSKIGNPSITMVRITDEYEPVPIGGPVAGDGATNGKELSQLDYGLFLYAIAKMKPQAVAFMPTPVFKEESVLSELGDAALQLPRMTLGAVVSSKKAPENSRQIAYPAIKATGDTSAIPEITHTVKSPHRDMLANGDPAFTRIEGIDTLISGKPRIQLLARQGEKMVAGFVLASVAKQAGIPMEAISVELDGTRGKGIIQMGEQYRIPIANDGTMAIPSHAGIDHSMYEVVSTEDGKEIRDYQFASLKVDEVSYAAEQPDTVTEAIYEKNPGKFKSLSDNLVLLGFDKSADRTIRTLNDELLSPMTATARAIATIQSGRHTVRWPIWARAAAYVAIFLMALIFLRMRRGGLFWILLAGALFIAGKIILFSQTLAWTPPAAIMGLFVLMFLIRLFSKNPKKVEEESSEDEPVEGGVEAT